VVPAAGAERGAGDGSREWTDRDAIRAFEALLERWGLPASAVTVRHGGQGKHDARDGSSRAWICNAGEVAAEMGMQVDAQEAWHSTTATTHRSSLPDPALHRRIRPGRALAQPPIMKGCSPRAWA
jgi:hypothetical protein